MSHIISNSVILPELTTISFQNILDDYFYKIILYAHARLNIRYIIHFKNHSLLPIFKTHTFSAPRYKFAKIIFPTESTDEECFRDQ